IMLRTHRKVQDSGAHAPVRVRRIVIALALQPEPDVAALRARTEALAAKHPLYPHLSDNGDAR
ncbi:hypothetical protein ABT116_41270, partial [Streptomyces sp. NPDC002130]|uniref:hypothetical protein n=1 Tax=Streptomyces sp. NPDC002130 TaxID=3155568 RepID=UPI00332987B8